MPDPSPDLEPAELSAYFHLIEVSSLLRHAIEQQLRAAGDLSYVQFQLLARLGDAPAGVLSMTALADGVVYSRSGLTYQAGLLEQRGLLTRTPSREDERSVDVALTDAGRGVLATVFPGHIALMRELFLAPLSGDDIRSLDDILGRARDHMRRIPPRSASPRRRKTTPGA